MKQTKNNSCNSSKKKYFNKKWNGKVHLGILDYIAWLVGWCLCPIFDRYIKERQQEENQHPISITKCKI